MKKITLILVLMLVSSCKHYYCLEYKNTTSGYTKDIQNQWGHFYTPEEVEQLNNQPEKYHCVED
jgi:predicted small secreted protein